MIFIIKGILFLLLFTTIFLFINYVKENYTNNDIYELVERKYLKRKSEKEQIRIEMGNVKEKTFLGKMDLLIERSGIRKKIHFFNTESYMIINIVLIFASMIFGIIKYKFWIIGIVFSVIAVLILYLILTIMANVNYERIDKEVMTFINILENYSGTNDDITLIMEKTYPFIKEPLSSYIHEFCNDVYTRGDLQEAFRRFEARIENERIKDIIRNLEICSRHEANYKEIIKDSRETLKDYLAAKEERKSIIKNKRIEITMCIVVSGVILSICKSFVPNIWQLLKTTFIGNVILLYCITVITICISNIIGFDKRG